MPIDFLSTTNSLQSAVESSWANTIFGGTVSTAVMISILFVLLIMVMYPAKSGTSFWIVIKMWLYSLVAVGVLLFLHDGVIQAKLKKEHQDGLNEISVQPSREAYGAADPAYSGFINKNAVNSTPNISGELTTQEPPSQPAQSIQPSSQEKGFDMGEFASKNNATQPKILGRGMATFGGRIVKPVRITNPFK